MASPVKRSRTVALSAERVLQSLEQKGDGNDGMSSGEESDLYLQETGDIYRSRYKVSYVTVLLRKLAHNDWHCIKTQTFASVFRHQCSSPDIYRFRQK